MQTIHEQHPFKLYLPLKATKLILGSFPCFSGGNYGDWFYSGSGRNQLWPILSEIYNMPAETRGEKEALCSKHQIAITDIAQTIERKKPKNCADSNLKIVDFNVEAIQKALDAGITEVLCTSKFVSNHFERTFPKHKVTVLALPSPSPSGNRAIGRLAEYKEKKAKGLVTNAYDYKFNIYKSVFLR